MPMIVPQPSSPPPRRRSLRLARLLAGALLALPAPGLAEPQTRPAPAMLAPSSVAAAQAAPGATPQAEALKPALWLVSDEDTRIYLFGTIHVLTPGVRWFDGEVARAFTDSDVLVTEVATVGGLDSVQKLLAGAQLPAGETLRGKLAPADRAALEAALAKLNIPPAMIDRLKPWYAAVVLSSLPLITAGYRLDQGVEMQLAGKAKEAGKGQEALETAAEQLALFDSLPEANQIAYLRQVVDHIDGMQQQIGALVGEWGEGDADGLAALMNADKSDPALIEALLTRRNAAWAEWIGARLQQPGTVFLAVGAGHLAGAGSVQQVLAERGITTSRVQ